MGIHPKRVSSTIGSAGFPVLGVVSVLILAYSLVPRIKWTVSSLFKSTSSTSTALRWSYSAKMSYQELVRVSGTPRFTFVIYVRRWKFPERFSITPSWISILGLLFTWAFRYFWTLSALVVYLFDQVRLLRRTSFRLRCPVAHGTEYHKLQRRPAGRLHCFSQWRLTCAQVFCIQRCSRRLMSGVSFGSVNIS